MRAVQIAKPFEVNLIDVDMPVRRPGEALIKILYGGICGSDLGTYRGTFAYVDYPRIPGHELSAQIVEIDENEKGLKAGDIVTLNPYINCGSCYSCQRGLVNCCQDNHTLGAQTDGAFKDYFTIPVERLYYGKGMDPKELALIEPYCIGEHGVKRAGIKASDKVLIVGAGTIGIMALIASKKRGATVYMADVAPEKLERSKEFGADGIILNDEEFTDKVMKATDGHGFDAVIEAVGLPNTFQDCINACAFGARMVLVGIGKNKLDFDFTVIQKKELNIFGSRNALKEDFLAAIDDVVEGRMSLKGMITGTYKVSDCAKAFDDFHKNQGSTLKMLLEF